ncbi:MAG: helix-turn-helix domain-containing protein [Lentisphaeria bacterium]|nr:helix-turn-helix domain-containing protein [Lentisphaeria bacterium]
MEQENDNQAAAAGQPIENDLFSMPAASESAPAPAAPVDAPAAPADGPADAPAAPETPAGSEPAGEPEFKINTEDRPPVRILNSDPVPKKESPSVSSPARQPVSLRSAIGASIGAMLSEARTLSGYSVEQVHQLTQIKSTFIEALEKDRLDDLPNRVFLRAYIRALISVYRLDPQSAALIEDQLSELNPEVDIPEKIVENIGKEGQINETEAKRVKMIFIYGAVILLLLISLTVTSIISVQVRNKRIRARRQQTEQTFDSGRIDTLLVPQLPPSRMLEVPSAEPKKQK